VRASSTDANRSLISRSIVVVGINPLPAPDYTDIDPGRKLRRANKQQSRWKSRQRL
jgi:hypothetical protein